MKSLKLSSVMFAFALITACNGNAQNKMAINHQKKSMTKTIGMRSQTIKLKKGELFLVISSITKPGAEGLMNDYFEKVFPIASKNGFKPLASLPVDKVVAGDYKPNNFVGLYSWPNMDAVQVFLDELPNSELRPMRLKIWEELKQSMGRIENDFEFTLFENKVYEVQTIWDNDQMNKSQKNFTGKIILDFPVVGYEDLTNGEAPSKVVLIEWDSEKDANKYRKKRNAYKMEESFFVHLQIPEKQ